MFKIVGKVVNLFTLEAGIDKEGKSYDESYKVQLMGKLSLPNGQNKMDLVDLKVDNLTDWKDLAGKNVSIDVGEFAPQKGKIIHFLRKGAKPQILA